MIQVLRLSSTWDKVQAPLQAWVSRLVGEFNRLRTIELVTFRLTDGVSPDPFTVARAGRPAAVWLGKIVAVQNPSAGVAPTSFAWIPGTDNSFAIGIGGLTAGTEYEITLCVVD
jgi:hypothetical protein